MFSFLLKLFIGVIIAIFLIGMIITYKVEHSPLQATFLAGKLPNPAPNGFYTGKIKLPNPFWQGKRFDDATNTGINVFKEGYALTSEGFSFITYAGKGLKDKNLDVFKIDYNTRENPWWLHALIDEIVEVEPGHYVGKLHIKFLPGYPFTLAFFELWQQK